MNTDLTKYGLNQRFKQEATLYKDLQPGRVTAQHRGIYQLITQNGQANARVSGKFAYDNEADQLNFPSVGDWAMVDGNNTIHNTLTRKTLLTRQQAGVSKDMQAIAANIDIVFICMSLNNDFNINRLDRYLAIAWDSMATPVIVLTKADLCIDLQDKLAQVESAAIGVSIVICHGGHGDFSQYMQEGVTVAFIGSSGVGKSTLINSLMGEDIMVTSHISNHEDKGRHTTTHRQLLMLPGGSMVIDTPGMRELQLGYTDISMAFDDIEALAKGCKFRDCSHTGDAGCGVQAAIKSGTLTRKRFESYQKLQRESDYSGLNHKEIHIKKQGGKKQMKEFKQYRNYLKQKGKR